MPPTKVTSIRFSELNLAAISELSDYLRCSDKDAINVAVLRLREELGLVGRDAVAAVEGIVRMHGDDAEVRATITDLTKGAAALTIGGEPAQGWTAFALTALDERALTPLSSSALYAREDATETHYALGVVEEPEDGASVTVRAADLPELVMLRTKDKSAAGLRDSFRADFALRRILGDARNRQNEHEE